jgi:uncharacterized cupredoxin-like copper-binding protein
MSRVPLLFAASIAVVALAVSPFALARSGSSKLLTKVTVTAGKPSEFGFIVTPKAVKRGIITFKITNKGQIPHDFKFCTKRVTTAAANSCTGRGTQQISPGQSATLRVTVLLKGSYEYLCTLPAHAASGMKGLIKVS